MGSVVGRKLCVVLDRPSHRARQEKGDPMRYLILSILNGGKNVYHIIFILFHNLIPYFTVSINFCSKKTIVVVFFVEQDNSIYCGCFNGILVFAE